MFTKKNNEKRSILSGWTQKMLDDFVKHFGSSSICLLITRIVRKVEVTLPEARERYLLEDLAFYGHLALPKESPLQSINIRVHVVGRNGLLRIPENSPDDEARFRGYIALANQDAFQATLAVLHVTLPGDEKVRNGLLDSILLNKQFGVGALPIHIWADLGPFRSKAISEVLQWDRSNYSVIERCLLDQTLDLDRYRFAQSDFPG